MSFKFIYPAAQARSHAETSTGWFFLAKSWLFPHLENPLATGNVDSTMHQSGQHVHIAYTVFNHFRAELLKYSDVKSYPSIVLQYCCHDITIVHKLTM